MLENSAGSRLEAIGDLLRSRRETISVAESVTAGHLQALLSMAPEATTFFEGGITTYNARQKVRLLGIEPIQALRSNCVSAQVAMEMALGVSRRFLTNWGVGVTGYASVIPEAGIRSLFAFYALAFENHIVHVHCIDTTERGPAAVQAFYAVSIIDALTHYLQVPSVVARAS